MASKVLLGFNAAVVLGAYFLYSNGVRLTLDDDSSDFAMSSLVFPHVGLKPASTPASWGGSGELANYTCTNARMQPKFLSYDPVMVYIENFMSPFETEYLKKLACVHLPSRPPRFQLVSCKRIPIRPYNLIIVAYE